MASANEAWENYIEVFPKYRDRFLNGESEYSDKLTKVVEAMVMVVGVLFWGKDDERDKIKGR